MERNDDEKPGYFAIIPAKLLYNPDLNPNAKLLYGLVSSLMRIGGEVWASNAYFARALGSNERSVQRWLHELAGIGAVRVEMLDKNRRRRIIPIMTPGVTPSDDRGDKPVTPPRQPCHPSSTSSTENEEILTLSGDGETRDDKRRPASEAHVVAYCTAIGLTEDDGVYYWSKWQGNGFKNAGHAILDWRQTIRSAKAGGYAPSQRRGTKRYETTKNDKRTPADRRGDRGSDGAGKAEGGGGGIPRL